MITPAGPKTLNVRDRGRGRGREERAREKVELTL
jgi:hypothetical protein